MKEAEKLFTETFENIFSRWRMILSLKRVSSTSKPLAKPIIENEDKNFIYDFMNNSESDKIFLKNKKDIIEKMGGLDNIYKKMVKNTFYDFDAVIESTSLIFVHSILDDSAFKFCQVSALVSPSDWENFIKDKPVKLYEIKSSIYEEILKKLLNDYLIKFERESVLKKIDRLFEICKPPLKLESSKNYKFNRSKVKELDTLRHDIIHGNRPIVRIPDIEIKLEYLQKTTFHLGYLINYKYKLKIDPNAYIQSMRKNHY